MQGETASESGRGIEENRSIVRGVIFKNTVLLSPPKKVSGAFFWPPGSYRVTVVTTVERTLMTVLNPSKQFCSITNRTPTAAPSSTQL
jgi:hypothetical protein